MLKMSCAGCPGPSPATSVQFTLKMCVAAGNRKKFTKTPILETQGHSRSSTLTPIKSLSLLLTRNTFCGTRYLSRCRAI